MYIYKSCHSTRLSFCASEQDIVLEKARTKLYYIKKKCYNAFMDKDFISTVSHELRTPLTSIRGFSQTMLNSWDKLDDETKKRFLKIIEEQSNRLINLVENMLSINKLQAQKENLIYKESNLKLIIDPVISIVKNTYPTHKYIFEHNEKTPNILIDRYKFQQVMVNLVENAAKYSDEGTVITIKTAPVGENVSIKVIDNGIGIAEENYDKIFTKFSRIDNPLTRKVQGSGLGLYITKNLVEKMDGKISVKSENGQTTFEILMPVKSVEDQARAKCNQ